MKLSIITIHFHYPQQNTKTVEITTAPPSHQINVKYLEAISLPYFYKLLLILHKEWF